MELEPQTIVAIVAGVLGLLSTLCSQVASKLDDQKYPLAAAIINQLARNVGRAANDPAKQGPTSGPGATIPAAILFLLVAIACTPSGQATFARSCVTADKLAADAAKVCALVAEEKRPSCLRVVTGLQLSESLVCAFSDELAVDEDLAVDEQ